MSSATFEAASPVQAFGSEQKTKGDEVETGVFAGLLGMLSADTPELPVKAVEAGTVMPELTVPEEGPSTGVSQLPETAVARIPFLETLTLTAGAVRPLKPGMKSGMQMDQKGTLPDSASEVAVVAKGKEAALPSPEMKDVAKADLPVAAESKPGLPTPGKPEAERVQQPVPEAKDVPVKKSVDIPAPAVNVSEKVSPENVTTGSKNEAVDVPVTDAPKQPVHKQPVHKQSEQQPPAQPLPKIPNEMPAVPEKDVVQKTAPAPLQPVEPSAPPEVRHAAAAVASEPVQNVVKAAVEKELPVHVVPERPVSAGHPQTVVKEIPVQDEWIPGTAPAVARPVESVAVATQAFGARLDSVRRDGSPSRRDEAGEPVELQAAARAARPAGANAASAPAPAAPASSMATQERVDSLQSLAEAIDRRVTSMVQQGDRSMRMTVDSGELGRLTVLCREKGDAFQIEIHAPNSAVQNLLMRQEGAVRQLLQSHGTEVGQFDVTCGGGQGGGPSHRQHTAERDEPGFEQFLDAGIGTASSEEAVKVPSQVRRPSGTVSVFA